MEAENRTVNDSVEKALIREILDGNRNEYRILVSRYQNMIYAMIMKQTGDQQLSRELTQDAFIKAYKGLHTFKFNAKFSTWMTTVALNTTRSYFTSRRFKESQKTTDIDGISFALIHKEDKDKKELEIMLHKIRLLVQELKPIYRDVVVLCHFENRTYEEAARILNIPAGTICSRMNKAVKMLRSKMREIEKRDTSDGK